MSKTAEQILNKHLSKFVGVWPPLRDLLAAMEEYGDQRAQEALGGPNLDLSDYPAEDEPSSTQINTHE